MCIPLCWEALPRWCKIYQVALREGVRSSVTRIVCVCEKEREREGVKSVIMFPKKAFLGYEYVLLQEKSRSHLLGCFAGLSNVT